MNRTDELRQRVDALNERISRLSAAILRVSASLEVGTVLQEVVDSACVLTDARYGIITTIDDAGELQDFVTSGFTDEERLQMAEWPDGPRLFKHWCDLPGVLRLDDLPAYVRELGFSADLMRSKTFQCTPMRYRGTHVGNFFLAEKQAGEAFTQEDEEVLVLFASQAATAIANAQAHRDEQRARADLEALIDTSPVGVVVFEARTGKPVSINREAARIVECLRMPGCSAEQLLEVVTCRREDGTELTLGELPIARTLVDAKTIRAEEVRLSVPDGRSVSTLINVTPIRSETGEVISAVITMQDLAPLAELERARAQFLGLVSHELRTPLAAIKGSTTTMLGAAPVLDPAEAEQFFRVIDEQADHMRSLIGDLLDAGHIAAGTLSVSPKPTEVADVVEQARSAFLGGGAAHAILIDLPGDLPRILADRGRIVQVLNNLFANAARLAPPSSPIRVEAVRDGVHVAISVADEGRGIAEDRLPHLFRKHTGADGDAARGPGLGLAICKGLVEAHGGRIWAASAGPGQGAQFTFTVPVAGKDAAPADAAARPPGPSREDPAGVPVLVVDDDARTLRFVREALAGAGYSPIVTAEHEDLSRIMQAEKPKLVLLDLVLPDADGIELMLSVPEMADVPVIFISAYGRDETIARALESGAADYLVKPFSPTELMARIRAALRRRAQPEPFSVGDLTIRYGERRVSVAGREVHLTATEYELLHYLSLNAGRVVTFDALIRQLWSTPGEGNADRVRTFVKQLRRKLGEDATRPTFIFNVRAVGYRMGGAADNP